MNSWKLIVAAGLITLIFILIVGIERQRNCRYADGEHCWLSGTSPGKYGAPR